MGRGFAVLLCSECSEMDRNVWPVPSLHNLIAMGCSDQAIRYRLPRHWEDKDRNKEGHRVKDTRVSTEVDLNCITLSGTARQHHQCKWALQAKAGWSPGIAAPNVCMRIWTGTLYACQGVDRQPVSRGLVEQFLQIEKLNNLRYVQSMWLLPPKENKQLGIQTKRKAQQETERECEKGRGRETRSHESKQTCQFLVTSGWHCHCSLFAMDTGLFTIFFNVAGWVWNSMWCCVRMRRYVNAGLEKEDERSCPFRGAQFFWPT